MKITKDLKMVIVLDQSLPVGLLCNTAAVLSLSLGKKIEGLIDKDLLDGSGTMHRGLTNTPLPILKSTKEEIRQIKQKAQTQEEELFIVDVTDAAQTTKNYIDYEEKLKNNREETLIYLGVALAGPAKRISSLTGNLGLLR